MAYDVPPLPYAYDALEPHIDERTMQIHHDKHHQAYVDKVNAALEGTELAGSPIEDVLKNLDAVPGGHRGPPCATTAAATTTTACSGSPCRPTAAAPRPATLAEAIDAAFGSFDDFKAKIKDDRRRRSSGPAGPGSSHDGGGLAVVGSANQDNPISDGKTPLLGVDVWEHAYYLNYQNRRPDYLDAWWNTVDWDTVAARFAAAGA